MKRLLYLIPLFLFIFFPNNIYASDLNNYYLYDAGITDEQKIFWYNSIISDSTFLSNIETYPYYMIFYQNKVPFQISHEGYVFVVYFENIPNLFISSNIHLLMEPGVMSRIDRYLISETDNSIKLFKTNQALSNIYFLYSNTDQSVIIEGTDQQITLASYQDFFIYANFELYPLFDFNLYDQSGKLIEVHTTDKSIFKPLFSEKEYTVEDILNSDDVIYSLSKELIGPLPEEFQFIYSVVSLMLGILVLIVIISPFVLLKRWLM